jgi:transcriptional regulator with XRE-family HTH domain
VTTWPLVPFADEVARLLKQRGMSIRALATAAGVTPSHLSRVLARSDYKTPSVDLMRRVGAALGVPPETFPEYRQGVVVQRIREDPDLRDRLFQDLTSVTAPPA